MCNITRLYNVIDNSLFMAYGRLDYDRLTDAFITLGNVLAATDTDESIWHTGAFRTCCLADLIIGAYWHYTQWHGGQYSKSYAALCALGQIFSPGMSCEEEDNEAFIALNALAESQSKVTQ